MEAAEARSLFDRSAATYDLVNTIISAGLVRGWRRWVAGQAVVSEAPRVLDAFAGTGLTGLEAAAMGGRVTLADLSLGMLAIARERAVKRGVGLDIVQTDLTAEEPPFEDGSFDAVTIVFGVRYLDEPAAVLARLACLLAPGGRLVVLEFVEPAPGLVSRAAAFYFFRVLPRVASALTRRPDLYDYLASSVHALGDAAALERIVVDAGLAVISSRRMGFGLVHGIVAEPA